MSLVYTRYSPLCSRLLFPPRIHITGARSSIRSFTQSLGNPNGPRQTLPLPKQSRYSTMAQHFKPTIDSHVLRIMCLETDKPHPETQDEKGSFGQILHDHFSKAGESHHPPLGVETDQVFVVTEQGGRIPKYEEFDRFDGLLITGSMFDAHGDNEWILQLLELLRELWIKRPDFKFTGVCFGHQLLSRMLGAPVGPSPKGDWELGHSAITLTSTGQRLFRSSSEMIYLHQMHQDQVTKVPVASTDKDDLLNMHGGSVVECWGKSSHTAVQGLYIRNRMFTSQAHLAFDEDMVRRQIAMRIEAGGITDMEHADRAKETAHLEHDGMEVAKAILRIFSSDDDGVYDKEGKHV